MKSVGGLCLMLLGLAFILWRLRSVMNGRRHVAACLTSAEWHEGPMTRPELDAEIDRLWDAATGLHGRICQYLDGSARDNLRQTYRRLTGRIEALMAERDALPHGCCLHGGAR